MGIYKTDNATITIKRNIQKPASWKSIRNGRNTVPTWESVLNNVCNNKVRAVLFDLNGRVNSRLMKSADANCPGILPPC